MQYSNSTTSEALGEWNCCDNGDTKNKRIYTRRQRQRRKDSYPAYGLAFFLPFTYLLLTLQWCDGSKDLASSFQRRPPPPPPGSPYSVSPARTTNDYGEENRIDENFGQQGMSPPPPPPPPDSQHQRPQQYDSSSSQYDSSNRGEQQPERPSTPIHYEFPINDGDVIGDRDGQRRSRGRDDDDRDMPSATASARKDLVTQYWSSKMGKAQIQTVVALVGYGAGNFIAKSTVGSSDMARLTGYFWALFLVVSTWFRTPMGELSRAVGLSLILVLQRTQRIRKEYPTWRYVAASVGILRGGPRDARGRPRGPPPFPPARNPWRYSPRSERDPDFNMMYAIVSMAMVGSTVGGNLPFIPNWIGALVGAASFAFACTWQNSHRGDLARTMGMRVVRAVTELWEIQADLQIIPKATVVSSQVIDKAMILDRKHRVKDRFLSFANKGYEQVSKVAEQVQKQQRGRNDDGNNDRDRRGRRGDEEGDFRRGDRRDQDGRDRDGRDRDWSRDRRDSGRDREDDRYDDSSDERRARRRFRDDDEFDSRGRSGPYDRRRSNGRYEDEKNGRGDDYDSRRRDDSRRDDDYDDRRDTSDDFESDKESKGFFFGRK